MIAIGAVSLVLALLYLSSQSSAGGTTQTQPNAGGGTNQLPVIPAGTGYGITGISYASFASAMQAAGIPILYAGANAWIWQAPGMPTVSIVREPDGSSRASFLGGTYPTSVITGVLVPANGPSETLVLQAMQRAGIIVPGVTAVNGIYIS